MLANLNTMEIITKEQVKLVAPSVFTKTGSNSVSTNTHISQPKG